MVRDEASVTNRRPHPYFLYILWRGVHPEGIHPEGDKGGEVFKISTSDHQICVLKREIYIFFLEG
jgi:hypothetical protein